jgi:LPS sulfotransferase NodH
MIDVSSVTYSQTPSRSYVVCCNPRSGSTYLVLLLASTKMLGYPWEWVRGDGGLAHHSFGSYTSDAQEQIDSVLHDGCTSNGVCALKMLPEHFDSRAPSLWVEKMPALKYIYLIRDDLLGQAISLSIARQTNSYGSWTTRHTAPVYDANHINYCLDFIALGEARWRKFFAINNIFPLVITYEKLVEAPQATVDDIAKLVGIRDAPIDWKDVNADIQRDQITVEWKARFTAERGNVAELPLLDLVK